MSDLKEKLLQQCINYVQKRIDEAKQAVFNAQDAANEETKSSAGDKYETGREMMLQETDRNQTQLNEANKLMAALNRISLQPSLDRAEAGSVINTNNGKFFLSIGAGMLNIDGQPFFAVSPSSPIGLKLMGKKPGESFELNGKGYYIESII
ncbi:MAG: 3-oxoacyl-ACP synthase [Mucilaginibacter sp.]